jgi:hypothetical protein
MAGSDVAAVEGSVAVAASAPTTAGVLAPAHRTEVRTREHLERLVGSLRSLSNLTCFARCWAFEPLSCCAVGIAGLSLARFEGQL